MRIKSKAAAAALTLLLAGPSLGHDGDEGTGQLGSVSFANSCDAKVQKELQRAVAMLHSFWFSAGEKAFRHVLDDDPTCGVAAFGIGAILMNNPLAGQGASQKAAEAATAAIEQGRRVGAKTQRERDYIEAVGAYYKDFATRPERDRQATRASAYEALAAKYPDDDEARIFSALYIAGTQSQSDQTYAAYARATGILEPLFRKFPDHPGIAHYMIHAYDAPPLAATGLAAARAYSAIAPDAPHAQHMPSHIFTRVGAWTDSVAANTASAKADTATGPNTLHAYDYMVYAYLQMGQDRAAQGLRDSAVAIAKRPDNFAAAYAYAAIPARLVLERGDWAAAAKLPLNPAVDAFPWAKYPQAEAGNAFARALGAAALRDAAAVESELARLQRLRDRASELKIGYWVEQIGIQIDVVRGFATFKAGQTDAGIAGLRQAADREDATEKHVVTPGMMLPAREILATVLLERGDSAGALRDFEAVLRKEPHRLRAMAGAAVAAERGGDAQKARDYSDKISQQTAQTDVGMPGLQLARQSVTR